jgi:predicted transcriptional regulator
VVGLLTDQEISKIVMMRGLGFSQTEIAKELDITQGAVSYNLNKLKKQVAGDGLESAFTRIMAAGVGIEKLREAGLI